LQYDYILRPGNGGFDAAVRAEIAEFIGDNLVVHRWDGMVIGEADDVFTVFRNSEWRHRQMARLLERPDQGDFLNGYIKLEPSRLVLGLPDDDEMLPQFYRLACWVTQRWPGTTLWYGDRRLPLESLLPAET
jgi:hypothetical protein